MVLFSRDPQGSAFRMRSTLPFGSRLNKPIQLVLCHRIAEDQSVCRLLRVGAMGTISLSVTDSQRLELARRIEMRLTEILKPQNILVPLEANTKNEAIGALV